MSLNKLIIRLIRLKLGIKKGQPFYFSNQANLTDRYFFLNDERLVKMQWKKGRPTPTRSNLSINFLLSDEAKELIRKNRKL